MPDVFSDILCLHDSKHYPVALVTVLSSCCKMVFAHLKQQPCRMGLHNLFIKTVLGNPIRHGCCFKCAKTILRQNLDYMTWCKKYTNVNISIKYIKLSM